MIDHFGKIDVEPVQEATAADKRRFLDAFRELQAASGPQVDLLRASDVDPTPIRWLWDGWLPAGKLTLLAGDGGAGKTTVAMAFAAIVSSGGVWPDGTRLARPGNVLIWSSEDDVKDTLVPRLMAARADLERCHFVQGVIVDGKSIPFDPSTDVALLDDKLRRIGGASLLIVDPIVCAVAGDMHRANDVRRSLQALVDYAGYHGCAVLGISHFGKGTKGGSPVERVMGSQAFGALARTVLVAAKEEGTERRVLARAKSNIGLSTGGVAYSLSIEQLPRNLVAARVDWGETIEGTAREILGEVEEVDDERSQRDEARDFLTGLLADGPVSAKELKRDADGAGFSWPTIHRAASDLGVEKRKLGMKEGWVWALPKISAAEDSTKMSALYTLKSSGSREIFRNDGGLRAGNFDLAPEDFTATGVAPSADSSKSSEEDES